MKPRTLEEAIKAMDEAEARADECRRQRDLAWDRLSEAEAAARDAIAAFEEFTARHRGKSHNG